MDLKKLQPAELAGGKSIPEAASIFSGILEGKGTSAQNNVVLANTELALRCYYPHMSADECRQIASESLFGGKANARFKKLIDLQS